MPLTQMTAKRTKEIELRRNLREIRQAIDNFKRDYDKAVEDKKLPFVINKSGYPESLEQLMEGYDFGGIYSYKKRYLRRIPLDPLMPYEGSGKHNWGMRSSSDKPDSSQWGGNDVFDVYSQSEAMAIDGTKYRDW